MYSTPNFASIFDGVQAASETFSEPSSPSASISSLDQAKSGWPTSFGRVRRQAAHFSPSGASPVSARSGSPQMRIARCL